MADIGSSELFRFRTVRPIAHKETSATGLMVDVPDNIQNPATNPPSLVTSAAVDAVLGSYNWLAQLSTRLAQDADLVDPKNVILSLPADWTTQVAAAGWNTLNTTLSHTLGQLAAQARAVKPAAASYGVSVVPPSMSAEIEEACRLILVYDLVKTLAADQAAAAGQQTLRSAEDVRTALSFRPVVLPKVLFTSTPPVLARRPGVTDLAIVKDEWNRYIPGELANVVNVLPGETLSSRDTHLEETVNTQSTTSQQTTSQTTENSQTTSATLSQTATNDASLNIGAHAQVETSGQYGPTQVKTNLGAQVQSSQSSSQSLSRTAAIQTVARSVKTVTQTITESQTSRTTIRDTNSQGHKLQNSTQAPIVGQYRWLSVVHRVQVVTYPNRLVLEFEIPEPGAWLRWALTTQPDTPWSNPDPGPFTLDGKAVGNGNAPIQPSDITPQVAGQLAARWRVVGITPEPVDTVTIGSSYVFQGSSPQATSDNSLSVPDGYEADQWSATGQIEAKGDPTHPPTIYVSVGSSSGSQASTTTGGEHPTQYAMGPNPAGGIRAGTIPITVYSFNVDKWVCDVTVTCKASADASGNSVPYQNWQQSAFAQIVSAYNALLQAYNQERVARAQQQSGPMIVGPPDLNLARAVAELKKFAIQDLLGQPWTGPNPDILALDPTTQEPSFKPANTIAASPVIQFFEQVFEWENIVYICYPYFWGGRKRWVQNAAWASADPTFDQFLNAGSVRLVVPARPGFENAVNYFLYTSQIWSGQNPPGPNDPGYLSVADEIHSIQVGATDGTPVEPPWEITLPTTLLWAGSDPSTLPSNPNATIGPPPQAEAALVSIAIAPANPSLAVGVSGQLTATGTYSDGSTQDLTNSATWTSSATSVATVSSTGLAMGASQGTAKITATADWVAGSTTLTVTAAAPQAGGGA